jgi:hypothetical protein
MQAVWVFALPLTAALFLHAAVVDPTARHVPPRELLTGSLTSLIASVNASTAGSALLTPVVSPVAAGASWAEAAVGVELVLVRALRTPFVRVTPVALLNLWLLGWVAWLVFARVVAFGGLGGWVRHRGGGRADPENDPFAPEEEDPDGALFRRDLQRFLMADWWEVEPRWAHRRIFRPFWRLLAWLAIPPWLLAHVAAPMWLALAPWLLGAGVDAETGAAALVAHLGSSLPASLGAAAAATLPTSPRDLVPLQTVAFAWWLQLHVHLYLVFAVLHLLGRAARAVVADVFVVERRLRNVGAADEDDEPAAGPVDEGGRQGRRADENHEPAAGPVDAGAGAPAAGAPAVDAQ